MQMSEFGRGFEPMASDHEPVGWPGPDRDLLDRDYWRRDFSARYGDELDDDALDHYATLAQVMLGEHPDLARRNAPQQLADSPGATPNTAVQRPQEIDRNVWVAGEGTVSRIGWENPSDRRQGYGYRVYVTRPDGSTDIYAHMDPDTVRYRVGDKLLQRFYLGRYADPPNGTATGPHLHYGRMNAAGEWIDPGTETPVINGTIQSRFEMRRHPVLGIDRMHNGIDVTGPRVVRSDYQLP